MEPPPSPLFPSHPKLPQPIIPLNSGINSCHRFHQLHPLGNPTAEPTSSPYSTPSLQDVSPGLHRGLWTCLLLNTVSSPPTLNILMLKDLTKRNQIFFMCSKFCHRKMSQMLSLTPCLLFPTAPPGPCPQTLCWSQATPHSPYLDVPWTCTSCLWPRMPSHFLRPRHITPRFSQRLGKCTHLSELSLMHHEVFSPSSAHSFVKISVLALSTFFEITS